VIRVEVIEASKFVVWIALRHPLMMATSLFSCEPTQLSIGANSTKLWRFHFARKFASDPLGGALFVGSHEAATLDAYFATSLNLTRAADSAPASLDGRVALIAYIVAFMLHAPAGAPAAQRPLLLSCADGCSVAPAVAAAYLCARDPALAADDAAEALRHLCADLRTPLYLATQSNSTGDGSSSRSVAAAAEDNRAVNKQLVGFSDYRLCLVHTNPQHAQWLEVRSAFLHFFFPDVHVVVFCLYLAVTTLFEIFFRFYRYCILLKHRH